MCNFDNVSYFTTFHKEQDVIFEPVFNLDQSFSERRRAQDYIKNVFRICIMTIGSGAFGAAIAMFMSSFEFNSSMGVDTDRSTRSQLKQHFHGYSSYMKK